MADQVLGAGTPGGVTLGRSDDKAGMYGFAVAQQTPAVAVGTDIATVILELADLRAALVALGHIVS